MFVYACCVHICVYFVYACADACVCTYVFMYMCVDFRLSGQDRTHWAGDSLGEMVTLVYEPHESKDGPWVSSPWSPGLAWSHQLPTSRGPDVQLTGWVEAP